MMTKSLFAGLAAISALSLNAIAGFKENPGPWILGQGKGHFEIGALLAEDQFRNLDNWVIQIQESKGQPSPHVEARDGTLDCFLPGRGGTIWFKKKLKTRVTITYDVLCPATSSSSKALQPSDLNNFWMASDALDSDKGLFDPARYTGDFGSYDKIHGYYASTGGGRNSTTRMRRYPREIDGQPAPHLALTDKDNKEGFLITPDKVMSVQLVAFDDLIQYIVDGRLVYEIAHGDPAQLEIRDDQGKKLLQAGEYDPDRFPAYLEGYFGFRMVGSHHIYSNFRVHALEPIAGDNSERKRIDVSTLDELREVMSESDQHVVMKPGTYLVEGGRDRPFEFNMSGSNNFFDLSGVTIKIPISTLSRSSSSPRDRRGRRGGRRNSAPYVLSGDRITLKGGNFVNIYPGEKNEVTKFGLYNRDSRNFPTSGVTEMRIRGNDNRLIGTKMTVRGSFPYGYGNIYGIGGDSVVPLRKHCGIQVTGDRAIIDGCDLKMEAFGHAIYVQGGDQITVRNTRVTGAVRPSNDFHTENHERDLAKKYDYKIQWPENVAGVSVPRDHMINLCEDGIRAYAGTGHMTVDNCRVSKTRGGIKLYMAKSAKVSNCLVTDCVIQGYSLPSRGTLTQSSGNAAYGPLLYVHMDSHSSQRIELEVLPSPHGLGDHPLAAIKGHNHRITLTSADGIKPATLRPIIVGYPLRFDYLCIDYPAVPEGMEEHFATHAPDSYKAEDITLNNRTPFPVVLGSQSRENRVSSDGPINDLGKGNMPRQRGKAE